MQHSAVLIIPAAMKPHADAVGAAMGWGEQSYTIALGDGETVTHYAARTDVSTQFIRWIRGLDPLPDPQAAPVVAALVADFSPDPLAGDSDLPTVWGREHLDRVLMAMGLSRIAIA
jgi:hypothetical protein